MIWFQFPSNGKARVNDIYADPMGWATAVSIPFKREGTCERILKGLPSSDDRVSIPFKREGTCEQSVK